MKYLFAQNQSVRCIWELQGAVAVLKEQGVNTSNIVLLFIGQSNSNILSKFKGCDIHFYADNRQDKLYLPTIRAFLWYSYLKEDKNRENQTYVFLDSDCLAYDISAFDVTADERNWYCSDATGYLNLSYLKSLKPDEEKDKTIQTMVKALEVPVEWLEKINKDSGGAQWVIVKPKAQYWYDVMVSGARLFRAMQPLKSNVQKWTAEMWAQLWTMYHYDITPHVATSMEFKWATDEIDPDCKLRIYHNAGVTAELSRTKGMFNKIEFSNKIPSVSDLSTDTGTYSDIYVKTIRKVLYGK